MIDNLKTEFDNKGVEIQQIDKNLRQLIVKRPFRRQFSQLREDENPM